VKKNSINLLLVLFFLLCFTPQIEAFENNNQALNSKLTMDNLEVSTDEETRFSTEELIEGENEVEQSKKEKPTGDLEEDKVETIKDGQSNEIIEIDFSLKKGDRGGKVKALQEHLNRLGFSIEVTSYFDSDTEEQLGKLQEYYGLNVVDGIAGDETFSKIDEILNSPLQKGERNDVVIPYKKKLNNLGYGGLALSDKFGSHTELRIEEFQKDHGLPVSGILEDNTQEKINEVYNVNPEYKSNPIYQEGDRAPEIAELKRNLNRLGFDGLAIADLYGSFTTKRVKEFQEYYGLEATGNANLETLDKIADILNSPLQKGERNDAVIPFKEKLNRLGYGGIALSDKFGSHTEKRVEEFQNDHGLPVSGILEKNTQAKINEVYSSPIYQEGDRAPEIAELKRNLNRLGFDGLAIADLYGSFTTKRVREFQEYYGLEATGNANLETLDKIADILNSPLQKGERNDAVIPFKEKLNRLGYGGIALSDKFGSHTEKRVEEFQNDHGLPVSGILEENTQAKINEVYSSPIYQEGDRAPEIAELKRNLNRLGFDGLAIADLYGSFTTKRVKEFQEYYTLEITGSANLETLHKIDEILLAPLQKGKHHQDTIELKRLLNRLGYDGLALTTKFGSLTEKRVKQFQKDNGLPISGIVDEITLKEIKKAASGINYNTYDLTLDVALNIQMTASPQTDQKYAYVSKTYIDKNNKVTASSLNVRKGASTAFKKVGTLKKGDKVSIISEYNGWYVIEFNGSEQWVNARPEDVRYYLDPNNFIHDEKQQFQFLDLSKPSGVSKKVLNNYLKGKGILEGRAQAFIDGGRQNGINDVYLISHATLETGNGTSKLANGIEVGKNKSGNLVVVTNSNREKITNIKKVYNMYGIGAYDSCALDCGAKRAYEEGWTTPDKAIIGGAKFIDNYINSGQNTLYKMRWNPKAMESTGRFGKQYATDIGWASKQINSMYNLYQSIGDFKLILDIPEYK